MTLQGAPRPSTVTTAGHLLRLPHDPRAGREARARMREALRGHGVPEDTVDDAEIVLSELFGNAVRHARPWEDGTIGVRWRVQGGLVEIEVTDGGSADPIRQREPNVVEGGGHGLNIVSAMSRSWGVVDAGATRTVWAALVHGADGA